MKNKIEAVANVIVIVFFELWSHGPLCFDFPNYGVGSGLRRLIGTRFRTFRRT